MLCPDASRPHQAYEVSYCLVTEVVVARRDSWQADITEIRQAAARSEWYLCRDAAARLLSRLPVQRALEFTQEQVARRLASFEHRQPGVAWPRQALGSLLKGDMNESWTWPQQQDGGCSIYYTDGFLAALRRLQQADVTSTDKPRIITSLAHALEDCIHGDMSGPPRTAWRIGLEAWYDMGQRFAEELERYEALQPEGEDADLLALREAVERQEGNSYLFMARRLLSRMPLAAAMRLSLEQVSLRLPVFERHQPEVTWPRQLVEALASATLPADWRLPEDLDFPGPGASNFISAMEELWLASLALTDETRCVELLVSAIADALVTEAIEAWCSRHPEEWARYEHLSSHAETEWEESERIDIHLKRVQSKEYTGAVRQSWLALAARCAQVLGLDWKP
jgi:hypothetical protein